MLQSLSFEETSNLRSAKPVGNPSRSLIRHYLAMRDADRSASNNTLVVMDESDAPSEILDALAYSRPASPPRRARRGRIGEPPRPNHTLPSSSHPFNGTGRMLIKPPSYHRADFFHSSPSRYPHPMDVSYAVRLRPAGPAPDVDTSRFPPYPVALPRSPGRAPDVDTSSFPPYPVALPRSPGRAPARTQDRPHRPRSPPREQRLDTNHVTHRNGWHHRRKGSLPDAARGVPRPRHEAEVDDFPLTKPKIVAGGRAFPHGPRNDPRGTPQVDAPRPERSGVGRRSRAARSIIAAVDSRAVSPRSGSVPPAKAAAEAATLISEPHHTGNGGSASTDVIGAEAAAAAAAPIDSPNVAGASAETDLKALSESALQQAVLSAAAHKLQRLQLSLRKAAAAVQEDQQFAHPLRPKYADRRRLRPKSRRDSEDGTHRESQRPPFDLGGSVHPELFDRPTKPHTARGVRASVRSSSRFHTRKASSRRSRKPPQEYLLDSTGDDFKPDADEMTELRRSLGNQSDDTPDRETLAALRSAELEGYVVLDSTGIPVAVVPGKLPSNTVSDHVPSVPPSPALVPVEEPIFASSPLLQTETNIAEDSTLTAVPDASGATPLPDEEDVVLELAVPASPVASSVSVAVLPAEPEEAAKELDEEHAMIAQLLESRAATQAHLVSRLDSAEGNLLALTDKLTELLTQPYQSIPSVSLSPPRFSDLQKTGASLQTASLDDPLETLMMNDSSAAVPQLIVEPSPDETPAEDKPQESPKKEEPISNTNDIGTIVAIASLANAQRASGGSTSLTGLLRRIAAGEILKPSELAAALSEDISTSALPILSQNYHSFGQPPMLALSHPTPATTPEVGLHFTFPKSPTVISPVDESDAKPGTPAASAFAKPEVCDVTCTHDAAGSPLSKEYASKLEHKRMVRAAKSSHSIPSSPAASPSSWDAPAVLSTSDKEVFVEELNMLRSRHGVAPLGWDSETEEALLSLLRQSIEAAEPVVKPGTIWKRWDANDVPGVCVKATLRSWYSCLDSYDYAARNITPDHAPGVQLIWRHVKKVACVAGKHVDGSLWFAASFDAIVSQNPSLIGACAKPVIADAIDLPPLPNFHATPSTAPNTSPVSHIAAAASFTSLIEEEREWRSRLEADAFADLDTAVESWKSTSTLLGQLQSSSFKNALESLEQAETDKRCTIEDALDAQLLVLTEYFDYVKSTVAHASHSNEEQTICTLTKEEGVSRDSILASESESWELLCSSAQNRVAGIFLIETERIFAAETTSRAALESEQVANAMNLVLTHRPIATSAPLQSSPPPIASPVEALATPPEAPSSAVAVPTPVPVVAEQPCDNMPDDDAAERESEEKAAADELNAFKSHVNAQFLGEKASLEAYQHRIASLMESCGTQRRFFDQVRRRRRQTNKEFCSSDESDNDIAISKSISEKLRKESSHRRAIGAPQPASISPAAVPFGSFGASHAPITPSIVTGLTSNPPITTVNFAPANLLSTSLTLSPPSPGPSPGIFASLETPAFAVSSGDMTLQPGPPGMRSRSDSRASRQSLLSLGPSRGAGIHSPMGGGSVGSSGDEFVFSKRPPVHSASFDSVDSLGSPRPAAELAAPGGASLVASRESSLSLSVFPPGGLLPEEIERAKMAAQINAMEQAVAAQFGTQKLSELL